MKTVTLNTRSCLSEAFALLKLILVMPVTNVVSERSASALRVMNYLIYSMSQSHLMKIDNIVSQILDNLLVFSAALTSLCRHCFEWIV